MGHIELSRDADLVVVAPATADLMAKMAHGLADDLASTALLATDKPVLVAPAMNVRMWQHPATQRNLATLRGDGVAFVGPDDGEMACGEVRARPHGRAATTIADAEAHFGRCSTATRLRRPLAGRRDARHLRPDARAHRSGALHRQPLVGQAGPRHRRSAGGAGRRGDAGLRPGRHRRPPRRRDVVACRDRARDAGRRRGGAAGRHRRVLRRRGRLARGRRGRGEDQEGRRAARRRSRWSRTPTSSPTVAHRTDGRPHLVVGFAAETEKVIEHAKAKLARKGCDWIVANDVSAATGVMGGDSNTVHLVIGRQASKPGRP